MEERLDQLIGRQQEIEKQIRKEAEAPTVSKVLFDILAKIFTVYVRDFGGSPNDVVTVCRMWRSAVLYYSPGIWGRIHLVVSPVALQSSWEDGFFVCSSPSVLEKTLEGCKGKNITFKITNTTPSESINLSDILPYRRIFADSTHCWENLDVELPDIINDASINMAGFTAATLIASLLSSSRSLRHLRLTNINLKEETLTTSTALETLTLTRCEIDLSTSNFPALVELHFDSSSSPNSLTEMPKLRLLWYRAPELIPLIQISAPSLQTLDLASLDDPTWMNPVCGARLNPRVLLLHAGAWDRAIFKVVLGFMSNLEILDIESTKFLDALEVLEELEQGEMVSLDVAGAGDGEETGTATRPVACPRLSALDITLKEGICGDCTSQLVSLSKAVLKKYRGIPVLRLKLSNGVMKEIRSQNHSEVGYIHTCTLYPF